MQVIKNSHTLRILPVALVAGLVAFTAVQSGCSDEDDRLGAADDAGTSSSSSSSGASADPTGCRTDEHEVTAGGERVCCPSTTGGADSVCYDSRTPRAGDDCAADADPPTAKVLTLSTDQCISETCNGDLQTVTFNAETELVESLLKCNTATNKWETDSLVRSATVLRVCNAAQGLQCQGGYGYGNYGGHTAAQRAVEVLESTCREGDGASAPCPVGAL